MKTKFINSTSQAIKIQLGNDIFRNVAYLRPMGEYSMKVYKSQSYHENLMVMPKDGWELRTLISSDYMVEHSKITLYETPDKKLGFRGEPRPLKSTSKLKGFSKESIAFDAMCKDASSRLEMIETSCASVKMLHELVRICPA